MSLTVLCPTRGRPAAAAGAYASFRDTRALADSQMFFVIDADDPEYTHYHDSPVDGQWLPTIQPSYIRTRGGMTDPLNAALESFWTTSDIVGFVGDDHRFRTPGWDATFSDKLTEVGGGLAFANDGIWSQGEIPTQIFGSSIIWRTLGWMALPTARHLYLDNAWRVVGDALERLFFFPDVLIEHMHPTVGKGAWDQGYVDVNTPATYDADGQAFADWLNSGQANADVERVRQAL